MQYVSGNMIDNGAPEIILAIKYGPTSTIPSLYSRSNTFNSFESIYPFIKLN